MANPDLKVEIAFAATPQGGPNAGGVVWTDVSHRVMQFVCHRGRTYELGTMESGQATIRLANEDGLFDPLNTSSAYNTGGNSIKPYRMVRVQARYPASTGTWYAVFTGYIERWVQSFLAPNRGEVELLCVDAIGLISQSTVPSCIQSRALTTSASAYYPLGESSGSTQAGNQSGVSQTTLAVVPSKSGVGAGTYAFGDDAGLLLGGGGSTCLTLTAAASSGQYILGYYLSGDSPFTGWRNTNDALSVDLWVNMVDTTTQNKTLWEFRDPATGTAVWVKIGTGGVITTTTYYNDLSTGFTPNATSSTNDIRGKGWTLVSVTVKQTTAAGSSGVNSASALVTIKVNNAFVSETVTGTHLIFCGFNCNTLNVGGGYQPQLFTGNLAHLTVWNSDQTSTVATRYIEGTGFIGYRSDQHFTQILNQAGFTNFVGSADVGQSEMQALAYAFGKPTTQALQILADSEGGLFYIGANGLVNFQNRHNRLENVTSAGTLGDGSGEIPYLGNVNVDYEPMYVYNDVVVAQNAGSTVRAVDATSITSYLTRSFHRDSFIMVYTNNVPDLHASALELADAANFLLSRYKDPHARPANVPIFATPLSDWVTLLGLDVSSRVTFKKRPIGAPSITLTAFVERIEHNYNVQTREWHITVSVSPSITDYGLLDNTTYGKLDTTMILAY